VSEGPPDPPGKVSRPRAVVLGADALVPDRHLINPPPTRFTHTVTADQPYRFDRAEAGGVLPAGTRVLVISEGPETSRVADHTGLYVEVPNASLQPLSGLASPDDG
jgi:hypothetical protein